MDGCAPYTGINRSAALEKLLTVVNTLDQLNITHTLGFGSLIGVLRDKAINPNEVDNDFIVNRFKLTREIYDIFRVMDYTYFRVTYGAFIMQVRV